MTENEKDEMSVKQAMDMLGVTTKAALARALGIHRQHVNYWEKDCGGFVPELRRYQVRELARTMNASVSLNQ